MANPHYIPEVLVEDCEMDQNGCKKYPRIHDYDNTEKEIMGLDEDDYLFIYPYTLAIKLNYLELKKFNYGATIPFLIIPGWNMFAFGAILITGKVSAMEFVLMTFLVNSPYFFSNVFGSSGNAYAAAIGVALSWASNLLAGVIFMANFNATIDQRMEKLRLYYESKGQTALRLDDSFQAVFNPMDGAGSLIQFPFYYWQF